MFSLNSDPVLIVSLTDDAKMFRSFIGEQVNGRIALSTKTLEPEPGDMIKNPQKVYDMAEVRQSGACIYDTSVVDCVQHHGHRTGHLDIALDI